MKKPVGAEECTEAPRRSRYRFLSLGKAALAARSVHVLTLTVRAAL